MTSVVAKTGHRSAASACSEFVVLMIENVGGDWSIELGVG